MIHFSPLAMRFQLGRLTNRLSGMLAVLLLVSLAAPQADAQRRNPLEGLDRDQQRIFKNYTRLFCAQFFRYGDSHYAILPNYYTKRENSSGLTSGQVIEMMTEVRKEKRGLGVVNVSYPPPDAEVVARAKILPDFEVGHYGFVQSVRVTQIIGPEEMIVTSVELIPESYVGTTKNEYRKARFALQEANEDKTFRLIGFRTKGLNVGSTYKGPAGKGLQVAVMSTDRQHAFVLVNFDALQRVRTSEFPDVLGYVKISPLAFVDMVRDNRVRLQSQGDKASLISIYRRFYDRYRPSRVSSKPPVRIPPKPPTVTPKPPTTSDDGDNAGSDYERTIDTDVPEEDEPAGNNDTETQPDREPDREPEPVEDEEEDDWEYNENSSPSEVEFFGIPLGD